MQTGEPRYQFRLYGNAVRATIVRQTKGVLSVAYRVKYYGSTTRSVLAQDIIREDGTIVHTRFALIDMETGEEVCNLDTEKDACMSAELRDVSEKALKLTMSPAAAAAAALAAAAAATPAPAPVLAPAETVAAAAAAAPAILLRPRLFHTLRSVDGKWTVTLRELHRFRSQEGPIAPYEISEIVVQLDC